MRKKEFKFSVVTAVYNIEQFLEEAIESVISQDIGFEENIQLILVNDGATDKSGEICDSYKKKYPDNVIVVHKENGGVSSARNRGLEHVLGEYVNFLDGDDKLEKNAFSLVYKQFSEWKNEIDIVTIPIRFFDGEKGEHTLNNKFAKGTRIIDLEKEYDKPLLFINASFVKRELIQQYRFDESLSYAEDAKVVMQILLREKKYGVIKETSYLYRKRTTGEQSAIQSSNKNPKWYVSYMENFSIWALEYSRQLYGKIPLFVQFTVMYDLQWRFCTPVMPAEVLSESEVEIYFALIRRALLSIEDKVIMKQRNLHKEYKLHALKIKYGKEPQSEYTGTDIEYFYNDTCVSLESFHTTKIEFIKIKGNLIELEGLMFFPLNSHRDKIDIFIKVNEKIIKCETIERKLKIVSLGKNILYGIGFKVKFIPEDIKENKISFWCEINGRLVKKKKFSFGKFSPISSIWNSYFTSEKYLLMFLDECLCVYRYSLKTHVYRELSFLKGLLCKKDKAAYKAVILRVLYRLHMLFPHKETWLICDRVDKADDNGEAFFEYVCQQKNKKIKPVFAVSKTSTEYSRIKKNGKVIKPVGWLYKWYHLCGAKIISSQGEDLVFQPFGIYSVYYADLIQKSKFIFLQHGVTCNDLTGWLQKYNKNICMFVTSTIPETNSILEYDYGYTEENVKLLGFPRYDKLYRKEKKYITILPSWRAYLVGVKNSQTGKHNVLKGFEDSGYYKMYSSILSNKRMIDLAKSKGYVIRFMSHPNMSECTKLLKIDKNIQVMAMGEYTYRQIFAETDLLITDYSSVAFDFAYLRKPVVYYQSDYNEFYSGKHTLNSGYFNYENDGFGEIVYQEENLADLIIEYMLNDCKLKEMYKKRIDNTFSYSDKDNCKRVYQAICNIT